jgi:hypothetical protein
LASLRKVATVLLIKPKSKIDLFFATLLRTEMSLQPRFEDVLHLVMWNGYTEDARQAVYVSKEVYTDERVWFPFLIQQTYGQKKKTLPQIIAEHCTHVEAPNKLRLVPKKGGMTVYKPEERWVTRMEQLQQMAVDSHQMKTFERALRKADTDGNTTLVAACKNNCPKIVSYLLKRGVDYDQEDNVGATPQYYAYKSKFGRNAWSSLISETKFKAKYSYPKSVIDVNQYIQQMMNNQNNLYMLLSDDAGIIVDPEPEPPKKKLKSSEYKKQFGRR